MTQEEIVTALRYCAEGIGCGTCPRQDVPEAIEDCGDGLMIAAADLIGSQQRHIEALRNELCQYCGKYKRAHEGACNGCRWKQ